MFDQLFLKNLKEAHDKYGAKVQLNLFYRTDFFYGDDEFSLADMTDAYKAEFEANSDWLRLSFHAKQEFPDYPTVNASYADVKSVFDKIRQEVIRFAGEKTWTQDVLVTHWLPLSKEACQALKDSGVTMVCATEGDVTEYNGDESSLPYGHAARLLQNRKPEARLYTRHGRNAAISRSICSWNHISQQQYEATKTNAGYVTDPETGLRFKSVWNSCCMNLTHNNAEVEEDILPTLEYEYLCYMIHEQYYYPDYYNYIPNAGEMVLHATKLVAEAGFTFFTGEDLVR